jgi:GGDEF domain-containing protein
MNQILYGDVLFFVNFSMDFLRLYVTAQISVDYGSLIKYYGKDNADKLEAYIADRLREFCGENEIAAYMDDMTFAVSYLCTTEQAAIDRLYALVELLNQQNGILTQDYKVTIHAGAYRLHRQKDSAERIFNIVNEAYKRAEEQELQCFFADHAFIKIVESRALLQRETVQAVKKGQIL